MKYLILSSLLITLISTNTHASIGSRTSLYPENGETSRISLEPINGTLNFRMHGKKVKDDKWTWDGREGRYIYCVRPLTQNNDLEEIKCEKLQSKSCFGQNIPYEMTSMELTNFYSQDETLEKLHSYKALSHVPKCWSVIQPFLCAVLLPKCENINGIDMVYLPSLEMCKITMEPCKILYNTSFFPNFLKCNDSIFPSKCNNDVREMKFNLTGQCLKPLVPTIDPANSYKGIEGCGLECKDPLYTDDEHRQIRKLVGWCASVSLVLHLFAIFTFTIDWHNGNKYPALIIFYVNVCYMISCMGWLAQFIPGGRQDIVCRFDSTLKQGEPSGGENLSCIMVFILVYYFLMAATCWFVIFTYAWHMSFKAIGKIQERIDKKASYFHLIAWSIPLVLTITILAISEVDANSIVGICFVGYVNHPIRFAFVIGPVSCALLIGGYFLVRGMIILVNLKISSKQIISTRASKKIRQSIVRMGLCSSLMFIFIIITILCHIYEFKNAERWALNLTESIICMISSAYSEDDSSACRMINRPSISLLQMHLMSLFASGMVMASFVFTPSSLEIWTRFFRRKFGQKVDEPLKLQKHKVIAQAFAKRKVFQNQGRLSISFHNSHTDPVGLKFDVNSAVGSHDFSSTWANNLPRFVSRRYALTGCPSSSRSSHGGHGRRNSIDSEISFSVRHVSVESRRNSNDSQVSVKIAEMKTKVASRSRGSKSKSRSSRHQRRADFTSKRYGRKESSTSMESQVLALTQKGANSSATTDAGMMMVPMNYHKRRSGIADLSPEQINDLIAKNRFLLPYLTTSEDEKSSIGSFNIQDSKLDAILKQIGLSEHKIIENKLNSDHNDDIESIGGKQHENYSDLSSKENIVSALRGSKSLNRSGGSKKGFKTGNSSRTRKGKKSSKSVTRNANPLTVTNGSGKTKMDKKNDRKSKEIRKSQEESFNSMGIELSPLNGNLHGSNSGRSDIGIQTEMAAHTMSSMEFAENLMRQDRVDQDDDDDDDDAMENYQLLPKRTSFSTAATRQLRDTNEISLTESQKLKLLLLPSK